VAGRVLEGPQRSGKEVADGIALRNVQALVGEWSALRVQRLSSQFGTDLVTAGAGKVPQPHLDLLHRLENGEFGIPRPELTPRLAQQGVQVVGQPLVRHEGGNGVLVGDLAAPIGDPVPAVGRVVVGIDVGSDQAIRDQPRPASP
jgi:hypothetical protein